MAVGLASNALGTVTDVGRVVEAAHAVDAPVYVDAVHAAPHLPIDVSTLRADLLVCSPYKFFGPHLGMLYGRGSSSSALAAYRVRPAGEDSPQLETGTQNHEALAGLLGTFGYLERLGRRVWRRGPIHRRGGCEEPCRRFTRTNGGCRLGHAGRLASVPGLHLYGIADPGRLDERVPTFSFTFDGDRHGRSPRTWGPRDLHVGRRLLRVGAGPRGSAWTPAGDAAHRPRPLQHPRRDRPTGDALVVLVA